MNKGKEFWAPRKHGFDDDGPMPYEPKQRLARPPGRTEGSIEDAFPSSVTPANQPTVHAAGHDTVLPGAKMRVVVAAGAKGPQVQRIVSLDASTAIERPRRPFDA